MSCEDKTYPKSILEWVLNKRILKGVLMCPECHKELEERIREKKENDEKTTASTEAP